MAFPRVFPKTYYAKGDRAGRDISVVGAGEYAISSPRVSAAPLPPKQRSGSLTMCILLTQFAAAFGATPNVEKSSVRTRLVGKPLHDVIEVGMASQVGEISSGMAASLSPDGAGVNLAGALPGTQVYRNVISGDLLVYRPGAGQRMADDITLASGECTVAYYSIRVAGLNQGGGPTFDVTTELWNDNPCQPGSSVIAGTQQTFSGIPNNQSVFDLEVTLDPLVPVPGTVWLAATFSTADSGWVRADKAEVGSTTNVWSENHIQQNQNDPPTGCSLFTFSASGTPWAGFWAQIQCDIPGNPVGACCNGATCSQTTEIDCGAGVWQGAFTSCVPNVCLSGACCTGGNFGTCADTTQDQCTAGLFHPGGLCSLGACGPTFRVFENNFATGIFDIISQGTKWGDDLSLGSGAPCGLASYEVLFAGDGSAGPATFNVHTELWTNDDRGTPTAEIDDVPGAVIPGTGADFVDVPANLFTQRLLGGPYPGMSIPKKIWIVMSTNTNNAGPVASGFPSIGMSLDGFAIYNAQGGANVWTPGFWYDGFDPTNCPGPQCVPAGSFRVTVWCAGEPPTGACCNDSAGTCLNNVREADCNGRWREGFDCGPETFEPVCGASACCFPIGPDHIMLCQDATAQECQDLEGASKPGSFCNEVECPMYTCLNRSGDCFSAHAGVGCEDAYCCDVVCDQNSGGDPFCCTTEWDSTCAQSALTRCEQPLQNDNCADALPINGIGDFAFDNTDGTTDGPVHPICGTLGGDEQISRDVWFCWTSTCNSQVLARTCGSTTVDTKIAVYEGCQCPPSDANLLDCDDDRCAPLQSLAAFNAVAGQQYLIRLGSYPGEAGGQGALTISCSPPNNPACPAAGDCCEAHAAPGACANETCCETVCLCDPFCCTTEWDDACAGNGFNESGCGAAELCASICTPSCPAGAVTWVDPPNGVVDARRPHPPNNPTALQGIQTFTVQAPAGSDRVECWDICETDLAGGMANSVVGVLDEGRGRFTISLQRPITPGAVTTITYVGSGAMGTFVAHPSNVNSDSAAAPSDILDLVDNLNGVRIPPLNIWQCDIDRSSVCLPADILTEIDLLNGANGFRVWNGSSKPATAGLCP